MAHDQDEIRTGFVCWWNDEKGYGFIRADGTYSRSTDVFVHIGSFTNSGLPLPEPNDRFTFKTKMNGRTGKFEACDLNEVRGCL